MTYSQKQLNYFLFGISAVIILVNALVLVLFISLNRSGILENPAYFIYGISFFNILIAMTMVIVGVLINPFNSYSKVSFIAALMFRLPAINMLTSLLAIVFGIYGIQQKNGKMLALAGITIGIATILFSIIGGVTYFFFPEIL